MITDASRYSASKVEKVTDPTGNVQLAIVPSAARGWQFNYTSHQIAWGDRPDLLAQRYYGDPTVWWSIADANPEILDWSDLPAGTVIRVPNV